MGFKSFTKLSRRRIAACLFAASLSVRAFKATSGVLPLQKATPRYNPARRHLVQLLVRPTLTPRYNRDRARPTGGTRG